METGVASSATNFRLSEVVSVSGVLEEGSSVDEVISIKAAVLGMPSSKRYENGVWFLPHALNPKPLCDFDLWRLLDCNVGRPSFCHPLLFDQW